MKISGAHLVSISPTVFRTNPTPTAYGLNSGLWGQKPVADRLNHDTTQDQVDSLA
jgi:hypothetical protein